MESQQITVVRSTDENIISIPEHLMQVLSLHEGDQVKAIVTGETLRLASLCLERSLPILTRNEQHFARVRELMVFNAEQYLAL